MSLFNFWSSTRESLLRQPEDVGVRIGPNSEGSTKPKSTEYDIIIVGGGTAALALAARLTESPSISVLVLEAGQSGVIVEESYTPILFSKFIHGYHGWGYVTTPQVHLNSEPALWPRAKLLGGCSSTNGMMFHHCAPEDYDEWARLAGPDGEGWAYKYFKEYLKRFERYVPNDKITLSDTKDRGKTGPLETGYFNHTTDGGDKFLDACDAFGVPRVEDLNTPRGTIGCSRVSTFIDSSKTRVSSESGYLNKTVLSRSNLTVATHAHVTRVLFENDESGQTRSTGVEFMDLAGKTFQAKARKEVVVSAGTVGTPHLLMLSGLGPEKQLLKYNLPVIKDLPGVGTSVYDHPQIMMRFRTKPNVTLQYLLSFGVTDVIRATTAAAQYKLNGSGPLSASWCESYGYLRVTDTSLFPPEEHGNLEDTTSGPNAPDMEIMYTPMAYGTGLVLPPGDFITISAVLLRPSSTGTITLQSANPFDHPIINANYCATEHDLQALVRGMKAALRIVKTEPLASLIDFSFQSNDPEIDHTLFHANDHEMETFAKRRLMTIFHPTSSARMAPLEDNGVVDAKLRVHGIPNLRVVDASVMPIITSGHTVAPTLGIAEKAADMIKETLRTK